MTAAWFHASRTTIKRSEGRSVVAAAAYRTATSIECAREGIVHDYTRKGGVKDVFVTTPEAKAGCEWAQDIGALTNAMEAAEKRKDAQVGHEFTVALPSLLDDAQRSELSRHLAQQLSDLYGVAVIGAVHAPGREGDIRNQHLHLLFTTREAEADGKLGAKVTIITDRKTAAAEVTRYRHIVADSINEALSDAGFGEEEFVDARSFAARGIEQPATEHMGVAATNKERRSRDSTQRGDNNRSIIEQRIAEQEKLIDALARQFDEAPPGGSLTLETERELAKRFGDEWTQDMRAPDSAVTLDGGAGDAGSTAQQWSEEKREGDSTPEGMQAELYRLEMTGTTQARPSLWARVRASADTFLDYARDMRGTVQEALAGWLEKLRGDAEHRPDAGSVPRGDSIQPGFAERVEAERGGGEPPAGDLPGQGGAVEAPEPGTRPRSSIFDALVEAWAAWDEDEGVMPTEPDIEPETPQGPEPDEGPDLW